MLLYTNCHLYGKHMHMIDESSDQCEACCRDIGWFISETHSNSNLARSRFVRIYFVVEEPFRFFCTENGSITVVRCAKYSDPFTHYDDVIMTMLASQITSLMVVYSIVYLGVNQRKHQSSASLAFVREIHRGPVNFPHKWPVTRKMFPLDDVIMN